MNGPGSIDLNNCDFFSQKKTGTSDSKVKILLKITMMKSYKRRTLVEVVWRFVNHAGRTTSILYRPVNVLGMSFDITTNNNFTAPCNRLWSKKQLFWDPADDDIIRRAPIQ